MFLEPLELDKSNKSSIYRLFSKAGLANKTDKPLTGEYARVAQDLWEGLTDHSVLLTPIFNQVNTRETITETQP